MSVYEFNTDILWRSWKILPETEMMETSTKKNIYDVGNDTTQKLCIVGNFEFTPKSFALLRWYHV